MTKSKDSHKVINIFSNRQELLNHFLTVVEQLSLPYILYLIGKITILKSPLLNLNKLYYYWYKDKEKEKNMLL